MYLTLARLKQLTTALGEARQTFRCPEPRRDASGSTTFLGADHMTQVSYGPHGHGWLEIDVETGEVRCAACAHPDQPTATPKELVTSTSANGRIRRAAVSVR